MTKYPQQYRSKIDESIMSLKVTPLCCPMFKKFVQKNENIQKNRHSPIHKLIRQPWHFSSRHFSVHCLIGLHSNQQANGKVPVQNRTFLPVHKR